MSKRLLVLLFLLPTLTYAQGAGTPPYRGVNTFHLTWPSDNTFDIGASGTTRPRTGYFGTSLFTPALTVSGLTATRCTFAGTGGLLSDDADCTFSGSRLTVTDLTAGTATVSALTAGRVTFAGASGVLADDADMTFASDTLSVTKIVVPAGSVTATSINFGTPGTGIYSPGASTFVSLAAGGTEIARASTGSIFYVFANTLTAYGAVNLGSGNDAGFARVSAGVLRSTNGTTGTRGFIGGGAAVASATALPVPVAALYHITGTTTITSITSTNIGTGTCITLIFDGALTFTDGSNLVLAGNFVTTADDTIGLCYDGTSWFETHRSIN